MSKHGFDIMDKTISEINVTIREYIAFLCGNDPRLIIQNEHLKFDRYDINCIECVSDIIDRKNYNKKHKIKVNEKRNIEIVKRFVEVLSKNFDEEDLTFLFNNLSKIEFKTLFFPIYKGRYMSEENKILLLRKVPEWIVIHELFHMASTNTNVFPFNGGFRLITDDRKSAIGNGLDEGFTDVMTHRYFFHDKPISESISYPYEYLVARSLEYIVGQRTMEKSYLRADLRTVVCEMLKYSGKNDVELFLKNTDYVIQDNIREAFSIGAPKEKTEYLNDRKREIADFLLNIFYEKYKDDENYDERLREFKEIMTMNLPLEIADECKEYDRIINVSVTDDDYIENYLKMKAKRK